MEGSLAGDGCFYGGFKKSVKEDVEKGQDHIFDPAFSIAVSSPGFGLSLLYFHLEVVQFLSQIRDCLLLFLHSPLLFLDDLRQ